MTFTVRYLPQPIAFLTKSEKLRAQRIRSKIVGTIAENPFCFGSLKIKGTENSYRYRVGDYRILYRVDTTNRIVTVYSIGRRENVYD
jgi:mRNA interferase RelE/StbE